MKQKSPYTIEDLKKKKGNLTHGQKVRLAKHERRKNPEVQIAYICSCGCEYSLEDFRPGEDMVCRNCKGILTEKIR